MKNKNISIELPYSIKLPSFLLEQLIKEFQKRKTDFMIIGAQNHSLTKHTKPESLDYWLRNLKQVKQKNTRQACSKLINDLLGSGLFIFDKRRCPVSGKLCNAIIIKRPRH